jgi:predicted outer membrane repeat protein
LIGEAGSDNTIIDCEGAGRGFYFHSGEDTTTVVRGFTIVNGYADDRGGGIWCEWSSPKFENMVIQSCEALTYGGGGMFLRECAPVLEDVVFSANVATGYWSDFAWGGGMQCDTRGNPLLRRVTFSGNQARAGGAIFASHASIACWDCVFENNAATEYSSFPANGGGVYCKDQSYGFFMRCTFKDNTSLHRGGGVACHYLSEVMFEDCTFVGNSLGSNVGAAAVDCFPGSNYSGYDTATLNRCTVFENRTTTSIQAAVLLSEGTVTNTIISHTENGKAYRSVYAHTPEITHCCIYANEGGDSLMGYYHDNLFADPVYCGLAADSLSLDATSPCLPTGNSWNELIGAYGLGCAATGVAGVFAVPVSECSIQLTWDVPVPLDSSWLRIERAMALSGPYSVINADPLTGAQGDLEDTAVWPETTFYYRLISVAPDDSETVLAGPVSATTLGELVLRLYPAIPNPFSDVVNLPVDVPRGDGDVVLTIHNLRGQTVRTLRAGGLGRGRHVLTWDGRDSSGRLVASGVYMTRLVAAGRSSQGRVVLLR